MRKYNYSPSICHDLIASKITGKHGYDRFKNKTRWRRILRNQIHNLLGDIPHNRISLEYDTLWTKETQFGSIQKIVYTSEPGADIPAYLCLPKNGKAPYPIFICLQGHTSGMHNSIGLDLETESERIEIDGDRDFALECLKRNIAAFCIEGRDFGYLKETRISVNAYISNIVEKRKDSCYDTAARAFMIGRTLVGERLYDVDRGIDFLHTRNDIDPTRIGAVGMSAGGMLVIYAMALLDRIQFAMPAGHFCSFKESLLSNHHCGCCYVPGIYKSADMPDIAGLFAPKPVVIVTGKEDPSKPIDAVVRSFNKLKRIYADAGAENNCRLVIGDGGHRFYAELAWQEMQGFLGM